MADPVCRFVGSKVVGKNEFELDLLPTTVVMVHICDHHSYVSSR